MNRCKQAQGGRRYLKVILFLVVVYGVGWWLYVAVSDGLNPHLEQTSACNECHLRDPVQITSKEGGTNLFLADIETLCLRCHKTMTLSMSHPIGMKPSFPLPLDMYLDWKGEITCTTCHYMHDNADGGAHGNGNDKYLRRNSTGKDFCLECHRQGFLSQKGLSHALATGTAHSRQFSEFDNGEMLGASSTECLSCHDGSIASDGGTMSLDGNKRSSGVWEHQGRGYEGASSHPIGIDYNEAYRRNPREITEIALLPQTILLPDGKVECVSCHNLFTSNESLLSVTNFGSRLCLTCHKK
jgi:predicted CXXCH cytochrome family protein